MCVQWSLILSKNLRGDECYLFYIKTLDTILMFPFECNISKPVSVLWVLEYTDFFPFFKKFYWSIVDLQFCVGFRRTANLTSILMLESRPATNYF